MFLQQLLFIYTCDGWFMGDLLYRRTRNGQSMFRHARLLPDYYLADRL